MVAINESKVLKRKVIKYLIIGTLLTGFGILLFFTIPLILVEGLNSQMVIKEGNSLTEAWLSVPAPITSKVWIWNIDNPQQFQRGVKPQIREIGPFFYKKQMWKEVISWSSNQESVKYWLLESSHFDADNTQVDINQRITTVNLPVYVLAAVVTEMVSKLVLSAVITPIVSTALRALFASHREGLLKTLTAKQLIEGYTFSIVESIDILTKPLSLFGLKVPGLDKFPENKFGLYLVKNNTKSGPYEVFTGINHPDKFGRFKSYQNKKSLNIYSDRKCNLLNGTDGTTFGKFLKKTDKPYIFNGEACRAIYTTYEGYSHVRGIPTWRFVFPKNLFASPKKNPENKCFCTTKDLDKCDGIFDLGQCHKGAPIAISFPHLWQTSAKIQSGVEGLSPDPKKHESYFDVNPVWGSPVRVSAKLQVNLLMKRIPSLSGFTRIRETVLPFVWVEESGGVEGIYETMVRVATYALIGLEALPFILFGIGIIVFGYAIYFCYDNRTILFGRKSLSIGDNNQMDKSGVKSGTKSGVQLFNIVENQKKINYDFYLRNIKQIQNTNDKQIFNILKPTIKSNQANQRVVLSPPGSID